MKTTRLISLLLASLAISSTAFAADAATAISLKGQARAKNADATTTNIVVGSTIPNDTFVQVGAKSTLGLKTADTGTLFFGPNSSFRLRHKPEAGDGHMEITVLSGTVSGEFKTGANGSSIIRTSGGVINTNGGSGSVTVTPGANGAPASFSIVVTDGSITIAGPNGAPVTIASGQAYSAATGVVAATPAQMATAKAASTGASAPTNEGGSNPGGSSEGKGNVNADQPGDTPSGISETANTNQTIPNTAIIDEQEGRMVISPNGEGQPT